MQARRGDYALFFAGMFPESINLRVTDAQAYGDFVARRRIDFVVVAIDYDLRHHMAEHRMLESLADDPAAACARAGFAATRVVTGPYWFIFRIDHPCA